MEFKGTKGNWILRENLSTIISDQNCLIARVFDGKGAALLSHIEQSNEIVYANAKLISCAPEMLQAIRDLFETLDKGEDDINVEYYHKKFGNLLQKIYE
jgi:hypothetical protein